LNADLALSHDDAAEVPMARRNDRGETNIRNVDSALG